MVLPEGLKGDLLERLEKTSARHGISFVVINGVDWNTDLTPWPAPGVFKKEKPFSGQATVFLHTLIDEIIPEAEKNLGVEKAERILLGVSLSGLFALWSGFNTDAFSGIVSLSGSLWYDNFSEWMLKNQFSPQVKKVCMLLGEKEKNAKDKRMATVEDKTIATAEFLKANSQAEVHFELVEGTHFSPIMPRMERALSYM